MSQFAKETPSFFFFFASLGKTRGIQIRKLMFWGVQLPSVERDLSATGMLY